MLSRWTERLQDRFISFIKGKKRKLNAKYLPSVMNAVVKAHEKESDVYKPPISKMVFVLNSELSKLVFSKQYDNASARNKVFGVFSNIISPFMSFLHGNNLAHSERNIYKKHFKSSEMKNMLFERTQAFLEQSNKTPLQQTDLETHCIKLINDFVGDMLFGTKHIDINTYKTLSEKLDDILSQTPVELENPMIVKEVSEDFFELNNHFLKYYDRTPSSKTAFLTDIEAWYRALTDSHPELGTFSASDLAPAGRITALGNIMKSAAFILYQLAMDRQLKERLLLALNEGNVEILKAYVERSLLYYMVTPAVARHISEDIVFGDTIIKKNSLVMVPMRAIARLKLRSAFNKVKLNHTDLSGKSLEEWLFDLDTALPPDVRLYKYPFTPFGLGHRKCPAASGFTVMFLMVITAIYTKCDLTLDVDGEPLIKIDDHSMANPIPKVNVTIAKGMFDNKFKQTLERITEVFYR